MVTPRGCVCPRARRSRVGHDTGVHQRARDVGGVGRGASFPGRPARAGVVALDARVIPTSRQIRHQQVSEPTHRNRRVLL